MVPENVFLLDAKEKLNIQKLVEFHALSFYPSKSEIWRGGRFLIKSGDVLLCKIFVSTKFMKQTSFTCQIIYDILETTTVGNLIFSEVNGHL